MDACALERRIADIERSAVRDTAAFTLLSPLLVDSARVVKSPFSPDVTERFLPGSVYAPICVQRISEDRAGFTLLAPLLYRDWGTNIYARDMHARNLALVRRHPDRRVFLLRPINGDTNAPLQLYPLRQDSLLAAWSAAAGSSSVAGR